MTFHVAHHCVHGGNFDLWILGPPRELKRPFYPAIQFTRNSVRRRKRRLADGGRKLQPVQGPVMILVLKQETLVPRQVKGLLTQPPILQAFHGAAI